jgi:DNA-directed RNA polymerase subunit RPC12/RpoP
MFFVYCKGCDTTNICDGNSYGTLMICGKCGRRFYSRPNITPVQSLPIVCEICGSRNLREEYVNHEYTLVCEDCACEREAS